MGKIKTYIDKAVSDYEKNSDFQKLCIDMITIGDNIRFQWQLDLALTELKERLKKLKCHHDT
jgi:hypothetical protein